MPIPIDRLPKPSTNGHAVNGHPQRKLAGGRLKNFLGRKEEKKSEGAIKQRIDRFAEIMKRCGPPPESWPTVNAEKIAEHCTALGISEDDFKAIKEQKKKANSNGSPGSPGAMFANDLLTCIKNNLIVELWHTADGKAFATIKEKDHVKHLPIRSKPFRQLISKEFYTVSKGKCIASVSLQDFLNALEGIALHEGAEHRAEVRIAGTFEKVYVNLANDAGEVVVIDGSDWTIISNTNCSIRFCEPPGTKALPRPIRGGSAKSLRQFWNVSDKQWPLALGGLIDALKPSGPYLVNQVYGGQGDGKSTVCKVFRWTIDPNVGEINSMPRNERDLVISATNTWLQGFDNASYLSPEMSDSLCRLATGAGFRIRELYSNDGEWIVALARPVVINGIEISGVRSDLLDRSIILTLPAFKDGKKDGGKKRLSEDEFIQQFEKALPEILGWLYSAVSCAIKRLPEVRRLNKSWPRMVDSAQWIHAASPALGLIGDAFLNAYTANRFEANQSALEGGSPIVKALEDMLKRKKGRFQATASKLLEQLSIGQDTKRRGWPRSAAVLSGILNRLAPNLRAVGIECEQVDKGTGNEKRKEWCIYEYNPNATVTYRGSPYKKLAK